MALKSLAFYLFLTSCANFTAATQEPINKLTNAVVEFRLPGTLQILPPDTAEKIVNLLDPRSIARLAKTCCSSRNLLSQILIVERVAYNEYVDWCSDVLVKVQYNEYLKWCDYYGVHHKNVLDFYFRSFYSISNTHGQTYFYFHFYS